MTLQRHPLIGFWVAGLPKPQGSKRAFLHPSTRRVVMTESAGAPLKDWRHDVKLAARDAMNQCGLTMVTAPTGIILDVEFVLHRPTGLPKTKPTPAAVKKPDRDKLLRGVCDALTGIVYADDSQVVDGPTAKRTAELGEPTGAHIAVFTDQPVADPATVWPERLVGVWRCLRCGKPVPAEQFHLFADWDGDLVHNDCNAIEGLL